MEQDKQAFHTKENSQLVFPLAWVYTFKDAANPLYQSPAVREVIDELLIYSREEMSDWRRAAFAFCHAYMMLKPILTPAEQSEWKTELMRQQQIMILPTLKKRERLTVRKMNKHETLKMR